MDFKEQLRRQLGFLSTSCREYDSGNHDEAIRLAMPLRVMFHQTAQSTSLMTHLGARFIRLLSTASKLPKNNGGSWPGIVQFELDPQNSIFRCHPKFNATRAEHRDLQLADWWASDTIYRRDHGKIRRRDLVLAAANKDGGGHVDPDLPPDYEWLSSGAGWKVTLRPDNGPERDVVLYGAHLAALRQIAFEVLSSRQLTNLAAE